MRKVMIVEDEELILEGIKSIGHWEALDLKLVHMAHNGLEALELWDQEPVDIIITDIEMPEMDGHRLTKLVKSDDATKDIPIIIFSSLVNDDMKRKGEALGADAQLSKPEIGNLVRIVDELVAEKHLDR